MTATGLRQAAPRRAATCLPLAPLEDLLRPEDDDQLAAMLGVSRKWVNRARLNGLTTTQADRALTAVCAFGPLVYGELWDEVFEAEYPGFDWTGEAA